MSSRRRRRSQSALSLSRVVVVCGLLAALAVVVWLLVRNGGQPQEAGTSVSEEGVETGVSGKGEFADQLSEVIGRFAVEADQVRADTSIEKVDGQFVRHWSITADDAARAVGIADAVTAEAQRWDAAVQRDVVGQDAIVLRVDLGVEVFDLRFDVAEAPQQQVTVAATPTPEPRRKPAPGSRGRLALILDDAGYSLDQLEAVAALPAEVAVAVLPHLPHSSRWAARVHEAGHEVLLHLPMEPLDPAGRPGPGAVRVTMSEDEIRTAVRSAINSVPYVVGVNNHMGSRATADLRTMTWVLQEVSARGMYFVDSRTTVQTVAEDAARAQGVPVARRHVFLDNDQQPAAIQHQLEKAVELARLDGWAVAIGHVHASTVSVIAQSWPMLRHLGADPVAPSEVVR